MIERVGEYRNADFAVQQALFNVIDFLNGKLTKKNGENLYTIAALKAAAENTELFRKHGYLFGEVRYHGHESDKRGKLKSVKAYFRRYKGMNAADWGEDVKL